MPRVIALRTWLRSPSSRVRSALVVSAVLGFVIWAHSPGEGHAMPAAEHPEEMAMAVCVAVLAGGSLSLLSQAGRRLIARISAWRQAAPWRLPVAPAVLHEPQQRAPPRAGQATLQVFLR